jgi:hypothetical protein
MDNQQYDEEDSWSSSSTGQKQFQLKSYWSLVLLHSQCNRWSTDN